MTIFIFVNFPWNLFLTICQVYQVTCLAMTTNERINVARYKHFQTGQSYIVLSGVMVLVCRQARTAQVSFQQGLVE